MWQFASPTNAFLLLGADVAIRPGRVSVSLPSDRRGALISDINDIIRVGILTPGRAAQLRGRLGFPQSLMFWKFGRVMLQPITNRQYSRAIGGPRAINGEIMEVLSWWASVLKNDS